ncbi:alkaline phosphatase [Kordiimonas lacus]|uniref:Alkaline phosphatase n=1 Tax=Kordiimonas lacus TaxID=637679 RepID=A0A1G6VWY1_9PROT|nr:alkaline phosphatase [Kordiimonas lacus]SDD57923.1 alkaline phosphatase [Kordiimonas lacus]
MKNIQLRSVAIATTALATSLFAASAVAQDTGTTESWFDAGAKAVTERAVRPVNTKQAKNVILFVGDGMGISTLTAGRILEGQLQGKSGEENYLSFERFPYTALVKTYNVDAQVPDSAGTASALNTGVKTRIGAINTAPTQPNAQCAGAMDTALTPLAYYAEQAGMATGIVSTARLTHATPAAVYAHSPSRQWENDGELPEEAVTNGCRDIAQQMLDPIGGNGLEVALGGGRSNFLPDGTGEGRRKDGRDLTKEWLASDSRAAYVENEQRLAQIDIANTSRLLGLFDKSHMQFEAQRGDEQPDLAEMTEVAIKMLQKSDGGYYLMVEAGRIDHGHHGGSAKAALFDTVALSKAVRKAMEMVDLDETLILVTADHSHVFTMAGYPKRGNPIFGLVTGPYETEPTLAEDGKPYTTLAYQNGPGAVKGERKHLTEEDIADPMFKPQALVPTRSETHGGEDVALFAIGPWAHLVSGTMEQNVVFHIMDKALNLRKRAAD